MENSYTRLSKSQSFSRHASNNDIKASLIDIKNDYTKALEQIEDLKSERSYLKAALNRSVEEKHNRSVGDGSISVGHVSQTLKNSYASKALVESERHVLDLEEENKQLKKLVKTHGKKLLKMQEEILSYQYQVDKLGYLKVYNQDLQAEMELLDQEFQAIIKRIDDIDEDKSHSQINQSLSIKNKNFKQILLKYANYITRTVSSLDSKNTFRFRFEETFSSGSDLLNLIANKDYSTLILKAMKLIIDLLPNNPDLIHEESVNNSPFSVGEITPQKATVFPTLNDQIFSQLPDLSAHSSILLPTSLTRGMQNSQAREGPSSQIRYQVKSPTGVPPQAAHPVEESHKKPRGTQSSLSFGTRESKPQSLDMKGVETPKSMRSQHDIVQRLEVSPTDPTERPTHNFPEIKMNTSHSARGSPYIREEFDHRTAAELELIQREKDLIQRERELMDKKKEYLMRSRELNERDQSMSEQRSIRENMRSPNETSVEHGRIKSQRRIQTFEMDDSTLRIREEDEEFEQQRREEEYEQHRRSPMQLKSILKSSSSQMIDNLDREKDSIVQRRKEDETLSIGSAGQVRSAKDISNALREKSKHIAKVLTKGSLYEDDLQSVSKSEHDISMQKDSTINRSRDRSPVNSYKVFEEEGVESLKATKMKSSDKIFHEDFESRFGSNDTSLVADKKSWFYPKGIRNQSMNKNPLSAEPRKESNESKKDDSSNKKVSFYAQYQKSSNSENQDSVTSHNQSQSQRTGHTTDYDRQQSVAFGNSRRFNEVPRGTQYASFSVAFGRTESAERDPSSPLKNLGSIIDVYMKKRVDHTYQTYDVVKGEEAFKKAVRDSGSPQYKVVADGSLSGRRSKKCYFNSEDFMSSAGKASN